MIDKPSGPTSHDMVARGQARHRDQNESDMPEPSTHWQPVSSSIGIGRGTRLLRYVQESHKEYVARIRFGIATDSLDADGRETWREPMPMTRDDV